MSFFSNIVDDVASTATLGYCDGSGCSDVPEHGAVGKIYNKVTANMDNSSSDSSDPVSQMNNALSVAGIQSFWQDLPADQRSLIIKIGLGIFAYYVLEIVYKIAKRL